MVAKTKQPKIGSVYSMLLPNRKYGYGRVLKDGGFQVFMDETDAQDFDNIDKSKVEFTVSMYFDAYNNSKLIHVGEMGFDTEEEKWPPKTYIYNPVSGDYSIYFKGELIPSNKNECIGYESTAAWELTHVIERKMGNNRWVNILV